MTIEPHFFRREYGRLVAMLSRRVGLHRLDAVEDAVQAALLAATEAWARHGPPENPSAWLFRAAQHDLADELRKNMRRQQLAVRHLDAPADVDPPQVFLAHEVRDDLLRMLYVCCDGAIPVESQLVLALRTLCGFDVREIAQRLFVSEAKVYKRLTRARARLRETGLALDQPTDEELRARLPAVRAILYLLFTEGYLSSHAEHAIRAELCDEAKRLTELLAEHPLSAEPETYALLALMYLHAARIDARQDGSGGLLLLEEQDRSLWREDEIFVGMTWLARAASGEVFSRYHGEAAIAAEHSLAPSFEATRWDRIVENYGLLEKIAPSALHTLNRAVAVAELDGPRAALALLAGLDPPSWLAGSHLWAAVLADLHRRCGDVELARGYRAAALAAAPSPQVRSLLERRLRVLDR